MNDLAFRRGRYGHTRKIGRGEGRTHGRMDEHLEFLYAIFDGVGQDGGWGRTSPH